MTHSEHGLIPAITSREVTRDNDDQTRLLADQSHADDGLIAEEEVKRSRKFTTKQKLILASLCATNLCHLLAYSLIAPFFPNEVKFFALRIIYKGQTILKLTEKHFPIRSLKKAERQQWPA